MRSATRTAVRRAVVAGALAPALTLLTACGGADAGSNKAGADTSPASSSPGGSGTDGSGTKPLTKTQLESALITSADVPGYAVTKSEGQEEMNAADALKTDVSRCQPLVDPASTKPKYERKAYATTTFTEKKAITAEGSELNMVLLASHAPGEAEKTMTDLTAALKDCTSFKFKATNGSGKAMSFTVRKATAPKIGDEAVAYVLTDTGDKEAGAATVTVVRRGGTTETYLSVKTSGGPGTLPVSVARKQDEKVRAAAPKA